MIEKDFTNKIEKILTSSMNNIKSLIDVDVVVGKPIFESVDLTIIPLTKVVMGYVCAGGEYNCDNENFKKNFEYPFSGGSGGGFNLKPIGFLKVAGSNVSVIKIEEKSAIEKLVEAVPEVAMFINNLIKKGDKNAKK